MKVDEIFAHVSQHMIEGLMTHSQMADYFGFLGLEGYQQCHLYHFYEENNNYKQISKYYLKHYSKIILEMPFKNPNIVPEDWWQYTREQVTPPIRRNAIQAGFEKWVEWEKSTKKIYEQYYNDLINIGEVAAAAELQKYIIDVDYELAEATQYNITLSAIDYNIEDIMMEQEKKKKEYCKKIKEIELC